jgi:ketosteroid isomerase-like protein
MEGAERGMVVLGNESGGVGGTVTTGGAVMVDGANVRERRRASTGSKASTGPRAAPGGPKVAPGGSRGALGGPKEEVVARLFEAFSRGDFKGTLALVHPEVVFQPMTAAVTQAGEPYRGHEGIRRYAEDLESYWEELTIQLAQIRAAGTAVVALGLVSGRGPAGSFEDAPTTWVVKFRDGLVAHAQIFSDERNVVSALLGEDV